MTEANIGATITDIEPSDLEKADAYIESASKETLRAFILNSWQERDQANRNLQKSDLRIMNLVNVTENLRKIVQAFIAKCFEEDAVELDDLKELANDLNIEVTKEIEVLVTVEYQTTLTVPIDFDEEDIDDTDFDGTLNYCGDDDVEMDIKDVTTSIEVSN